MISSGAQLFFAALLALFLPNTLAQNWEEPCTNPDGLSGVCIPIRQCPPLVTLLTTYSGSETALQFLRASQCRFEGNNPIVCCVIQNGYNENNNNNNNNPSMMNNNNPPMNNNNPPMMDNNYNNNPPMMDNNYPSDNGFNNPSGNGADNNNGMIDNTYSNNMGDLLPEDCGRDLSLRIVGGEKTQLDEFPWMALLEYTKPNGKSTSCGGALISRRYVVTAAHCIKGKDLPKSWSLSGVRLGEYDTQTNPDCISDGYNSVVCAPPIVTVDIEETIVHENYSPLSKHQLNDIALIRLARDVQFSDYIKPICLPKSTYIPENLWVAGWGKTENRSDSNVKLKISLPLSPRRECERLYGAHGINLRGSQVCAGGIPGRDTCRGDSGGPLMSIERMPNGIARWTIVSIVSLGPSPCGSNYPGIYTRVSDFNDWIRRNMRS